ncbi:MAG: hypothetical protein QOF28_698 [Actinomycetota bacterium]|nr:hypothetical protein [Actinomycetota bacterium]
MARRARNTPGDEPPPRLWVYAILVVVVGLAALFRLLPRWPGLAHEVALPPLDLFADVRVLMARATSVPLFLLGVVVALVARAAVLAAVLGFTRRRFELALRFYVAALVPAVVASGLDFSGRAILYAYLIWAGLLVVIITFIALGASAWIGAESLRAAFATAFRRRFRFGALAVYLVALTLIGFVVRRPGEASQVLAVPISGVLTALAARRLSTEPAPLSRPIAIAVAVVATVAIVFGATRLGDNPQKAASSARGGSLLLVAGVDTSTGSGALFRFDPEALGFTCNQTYYYSYRGPGRGGPKGDARCPIRTGARYQKSDTTRPLGQLASALHAQLAGLPRPVVIVTHSQGAWIAWKEITTNRDPSVSALVMLAPFNQNLAPYPPSGTNRAGAAGGAAARIVTDLSRSAGISKFDPDAPLARELQGTPGAVERLVARPLPPTVRGLAVLARADLPLDPRRWPNRLPETCPGWLTHPALPTAAVVTATIDDFLRGNPIPTCPDWVIDLGHTTDAFGAPGPPSYEH